MFNIDNMLEPYAKGLTNEKYLQLRDKVQKLIIAENKRRGL